MENREQIIKGIIKNFKGLTQEKQNAVYWLIANIDIVDELAKGEKIPDDEMASLIDKAMNKKDDAMLMLLLYKQIKDKNSKGETD